MSSEAAALARETTGHRSRDDKFLLLILADYAEPERFLCVATVETLSGVCMMDRETALAALESLEEGGFITCLKLGDPGHPSLFKLNLAVPRAEAETSSLPLFAYLPQVSETPPEGPAL